MLTIAGIAFYPYHNLDVGVVFFRIFGLSASEAGGIVMFVSPAILLLAFIASIGYGAYFLFRRRKIWQFIAEVITTTFALIQLPAY